MAVPKYNELYAVFLESLVDGKRLTELMIEFDVGVSTQKIYKLKRIDNDFFNEYEFIQR